MATGRGQGAPWTSTSPASTRPCCSTGSTTPAGSRSSSDRLLGHEGKHQGVELTPLGGLPPVGEPYQALHDVGERGSKAGWQPPQVAILNELQTRSGQAHDPLESEDLQTVTPHSLTQAGAGPAPQVHRIGVVDHQPVSGQQETTPGAQQSVAFRQVHIR